jgi:hypothetical protein
MPTRYYPLQKTFDSCTTQGSWCSLHFQIERNQDSHEHFQDLSNRLHSKVKWAMICNTTLVLLLIGSAVAFWRLTTKSAYQTQISVLFVRLISHQPAVLFSQNKSATSNQPAVLFSQNKPAPAISHQQNEQADHSLGGQLITYVQ